MSLFSEKAESLIPYVPGEQPKDGVYIKLNTNENPYPPSPTVIEAIKTAVGDKLRLYPDPECSELKKVYADYMGLSEENIFVGNGSDEVLSIAFQTFFMGKKDVLMPDISYSFYPVYCSLYDVVALEIPLKEDFTIDTSDYIISNNGVIIANPNAPTSVALSRDQIEGIVAANRGRAVIVDEAYVDFGGESAVPLVNRYDNLLVISTLSKSRSLAGLRVGFAVGNKVLIEGMNRVKNSINSYPVDLLAQVGAKAAILDREYFEKTRLDIIKVRDQTTEQLLKMGYDVLPSKANFIFIKNPEKNAEYIFKKLREKKILVRYFKQERISDRLRVSIGTAEEMEAFIKALAEI